MPELAGRGGGRAKNSDEYYATTPDMALRSCETIRDQVPELLDLVVKRPRLILNPRHVLEPTAGAGIWPLQMRKVWPQATIKAIELNPALAAYARNLGIDVENANILHAKHPVKYDIIAGNPPFKLAQQVITHLREGCLADGGILAFHARLNFLGSVKRYEWWRKSPPAVVFPFPDRPGYTADGATDGTEYAMFVWVQGYEGPTILHHMDNLGLRVRWNGKPARKDKKGRITAPAVLDPDFPDPRRGTVKGRHVQEWITQPAKVRAPPTPPSSNPGMHHQ